MKTLRVLTGLHAGACLPLAPGTYRIARGSASDHLAGHEGAAIGGLGSIHLFDWSVEPCELEVSPVGERLRLHTAHTANTHTLPQSAGVGEPWADMLPRRFGGIILCVGDAAAIWPTDGELLARLHAQASETKPKVRTAASSWWPRAGVLGAGLLVAGSALYGRVDSPHRPPPLPPSSRSAELMDQALAVRGLSELKTSSRRNDIVIAGLVRDAGQSQQAREAVAEVQRTTAQRLVEGWDVAEDILATVQAALRSKSLGVRYLGAGRFLVEGTSAEPERTQTALIGLKADLGVNVRELDSNIKKKESRDKFLASISAGGVDYLEKQNGLKTFGFSKNKQP